MISTQKSNSFLVRCSLWVMIVDMAYGELSMWLAQSSKDPSGSAGTTSQSEVCLFVRLEVPISCYCWHPIGGVWELGSHKVVEKLQDFLRLTGSCVQVVRS